MALTKFNAFVEALGLKKINLNTDTLKIMLTNTAPLATNSVYADISANELANGAGYTTGGGTLAGQAFSQTSGTAKLTGTAQVFTSSGSMGPFRYAVLYSNTATNKDLIGWWDYTSSITPASGETFTIGKDSTGANWDSTTPILSIA